MSSAKISTASERTELFKTLKANGFLLLYNLVESTLKNAIESIVDEFRQRRVSFDGCRLEVRKLVLKNLKQHDPDKIVNNLSAIATDVLVASFRKETIAAGNVDARLVRKLAECYGFASPSIRSDELLTVKSNRNDLAHGLKSFAEVGRDFDLSRLDSIREEVVEFLKALLASIEAYIINQAYLAVAPAA
jgi:MAE_28990/MAE_18760-like HEPN